MDDYLCYNSRNKSLSIYRADPEILTYIPGLRSFLPKLFGPTIDHIV